MSYGRFIHERQAEKRGQLDSQERLRQQAAAWVTENLPDLAGCPFASIAALDVRSRGLPITPAVVRERRDRWRLPSGLTLSELEAEIAAEATS